MIHESAAIEYLAYKDQFRPYPLHFDYPERRLICDAVEVFSKFGHSKELVESAVQLVFVEGTKKAARPQTPYSWGRQQKQKIYQNKRRDQDGDVNMR